MLPGDIQVHPLPPVTADVGMPAVVSMQGEPEISSSPQTNSGLEEQPEQPELPAASFSQLYQFTSLFEKMVLLIALLSALGAGAAMPMMLIAFGDAFDQLGLFTCRLQSRH